jgi:hypothetical protein
MHSPQAGLRASSGDNAGDTSRVCPAEEYDAVGDEQGAVERQFPLAAGVGLHNDVGEAVAR